MLKEPRVTMIKLLKLPQMTGKKIHLLFDQTHMYNAFQLELDYVSVLIVLKS